MVKQIILPLIAVAVFIIAVGLFIQKSSSFNIPGVPTSSSTSAPFTRSMTVGTKTIDVEVANSEALRSTGLSARTSLGESSGMLFMFGTEGDASSKNVTPGFWMKDMLIALDIIWIKDNVVVKIDKNIQPPASGTPDNKLSIYSPGTPINYVLEVNAGFSDSNNLKVGSKVSLPTDL